MPKKHAKLRNQRAWRQRSLTSLLEPQVLPDNVGENYTLRTQPNKNYLLLLLTLAFTSYQIDRFLFENVGELIGESLGISEYQFSLLIGPLYAIPNAISAVFIGYIADRFNKIKLLTLMLCYWSLVSSVYGFSTEYWQVVVLRGLFALSHSMIISIGLLSEYFDLSTRGRAIGILNAGTALSRTGVFVLGNVFLKYAVYRWVLFWMSAPFGLILILSVGSTIEEFEEEDKAINYLSPTEIDFPPKLHFPSPTHSRITSRRGSNVSGLSFENHETNQVWKFLKWYWRSPTLIFMTFGGAFRNTSTMVFWHYRSQFYPDRVFTAYPTVVILITTTGVIGAIIGGICSDSASKKWGSAGRVTVIAVTAALSIPFQVMVLYLPLVTPSLVAFVIQDFFEVMHVPCATAVIVHIVRRSARVSTVGMWYAVCSIFGGTAIVVLPLLDNIMPAHEQRHTYSLTLLYVVPTVLSTIMYTAAYFSEYMQRNLRLNKKSQSFAEKFYLPLSAQLQSLSENEAYRVVDNFNLEGSDDDFDGFQINEEGSFDSDSTDHEQHGIQPIYQQEPASSPRNK